MPAQTQQSSLFKKYAAKLDAALQKAIEAPVDLGRGPTVTPGQNNSIGQVTHCGFQPIAAGKTNAGEPLFRIAGVCIEGHAIVGGVWKSCAGEQTSQIVSCCDIGTPGTDGYKSFEQQLKKVVDLMRAVTSDEFVRGVTGADLEGLAKAIEEAKPYFRFSTSVRAARDYMDPKTKKMAKSEEGVWENWHDNKNWPEAANYTPPNVTLTGVKDASPQATAPPPAKSVAAPAEEPPFDLAAVVAQAVAEQAETVQGTEAQEQLLALATQFGCYDEVFAVTEWQDAELILAAAMGLNGQAASEPAAEWAPQVGQTYGFHFPAFDPATKQFVKGAKKSLVEIASVENGEVKTVTIKDSVTKRLHSDGRTKKPIPVAWTDLVSAE